MRIYMCIDLKSFYASVECIERKLDPLDTNLVVADSSRTEKTICLAVTPSLKSLGLGGRCRLFEANQKVKEINYKRMKKNYNREFQGKSYINSELKKNPFLELDYIIATPRMKLYMSYSTKIYNIYLKYLSSDDILVYSIDEVFCDITSYLKLYNISPVKLATRIITDVYKTMGITATCGLGTNMYLAKVAMDISAKRMKPNSYGVRIACLNEKMYKEQLWSHTPITDFWRVGVGYAKKLEKYNIYTMGDVARTSLDNEELLFKLFGVNAELLIDHAWGYEPCTIEDVKRYTPKVSSMSLGQVLHCPYDKEKGVIIIKEMVDNLSLSLTQKNLETDKLTLTLEYDISNITNREILDNYKGEITRDRYGREVPKHSHATVNIDHKTASNNLLTSETLKVYNKICNPLLLIRKIILTACDITYQDKHIIHNTQLDIFTLEGSLEEVIKEEKKSMDIQKTILEIKSKYGKNSILKVTNLLEGSTMIERNEEIGGHKG